MLGTTAFVIFVVCSLGLLIVYLVAMLCAGAVLFSRIAFSLAVALILSQGDIMLVASNGFLNYVAWALVVLGFVYLLSTLPKVDMAFKFLCTILLSVLVGYIVVGEIIGPIIKDDFTFTTLYEVLLKIVCTSFSFVYMLFDKKPHYDSPTNPIMYNLERGLASLMYGCAITFLFMSLNDNWELSGILTIVVLAISVIVAFVADIFLAGKDILGLETSDEIVMPK